MTQDSDSLILAIGAHPDDIEIGCAGYLLKQKKEENDKVFYVVVTDGEYTANRYTRIEELEASMNHIGAGRRMLTHPYKDNSISYMELVRDLEQVIGELQPDVILTHNPFDYHHDHLTVSNATVEADRKFANALVFYENIATKQEFNPNFYVDITDYIGQKARILEYYQSQKERKCFPLRTTSIQTMGAYRARNQFIEGRYYEAFQIVKSFG